ncbi:MAG: type II CAAX prenyl endopeptidase Rce1 family protein [Roseiflexaceae bacterium]
MTSLSPLSRAIWPRCFFWAVLLLIIAAEIVTAVVSAQLGLALHALVIVVLAAYRALARGKEEQTFALTLLMAPLTRMLSLGLPLDRFPQIAWYAIASAPLLAAAAIITHKLGLSRRDLGLHAGDLGLQLMISAGGLGLGASAYLILKPAPLVASWSWADLWLPALILLVCTGLAEEMIFRGVLQVAALPVLGPLALLYIALLFAALQIGFLSPAHVCFTCGVGLMFACVRQWSGSIIGISLGHGLTNIMLLIVMPYLAETRAGAVAVAAPWVIVAGSLLGAAAAGALMIRAIRFGTPDQLPANSTAALRSLRLQSGLGYVELARRTGIPVRELAEIEHGLRPIQPEQRRQLANVLGITQRLIIPPEQRGTL